MITDEELARAQRATAALPPPRGFAAKMVDYAATRARLGRTPSPPPEPRFPVLVSGTQGIISLPEQIRALTRLAATPEVITVQRVREDGARDAEEPPVTDATELVQVCNVTRTTLGEMQRRAEVDQFGNGYVWFNGKRRGLLVVLGAKRVLIS